MRMRKRRILPATCPSTSWSLSSFTRNIALGRASTTSPSNSTFSSFAMHGERSSPPAVDRRGGGGRGRPAPPRGAGGGGGGQPPPAGGCPPAGRGGGGGWGRRPAGRGRSLLRRG